MNERDARDLVEQASRGVITTEAVWRLVAAVEDGPSKDVRVEHLLDRAIRRHAEGDLDKWALSLSHALDLVRPPAEQRAREAVRGFDAEARRKAAEAREIAYQGMRS